MKINDFLKLTFLNFKSNKYKNLLNIIIYTLFMILISCFFTFKTSFLSFIDKWMNSDYNFKMIQVDSINGTENEDSIVSKLKNINQTHISNVFKNNEYLKFSAKLDSQNIEIFGNYKGLINEINYGRNISKDNEIICPDYMVGDDWTSKHNTEEFINMKNKLGQKLKMEFNKQYVKSINEVTTLKTYNYEFTLVGTYSTENQLVGYNSCYINKNIFNKLLSESQTEYSKNYLNAQGNNILSVLVLVDDYKNVNSVQKEIEKLGYKTYIPEIDFGFYNTVFKIFTITTIIIISISIICVYNFIKGTIDESKNQIILYKLIGYSNKKVTLLYIFKYIYLYLISFIASIISTNVIILIVQNILNKDPNFSVLKLKYSFIEVFIYLIFLIVITIILMTIWFKKKISKQSLIREAKE